MVDSGRNPLELARERRSRDAKIRNAAALQGTTSEMIRKQVAFALFFQRIFYREDSRWTLLGGNALLIRTGFGRFTKDVDLSRASRWKELRHVQEEIEALLDEGDRPDDFSFTITNAAAYSEPDDYGYGTVTAKINIRVDFGGKPFDVFSLDITSRKHLNGPVERIQLKPALDDSVLTNLPKIPTVPAENHLADKICALYEKHQGTKQRPSTRYRDLADIIRFIKDISFDAARLCLVLKHEQQRRGIKLPEQLIAPDPTWFKEYPKAARSFAHYPQEFLSLGEALGYAGNCLNGILSNTRIAGRWNSEHQQWQPTSGS